ncbi:MAG: DUF3048 domain-containing protein [Parasporobacterium sp.]|nr:DUF3048 domain-containing protein [Parasporobacterium sp.]
MKKLISLILIVGLLASMLFAGSALAEESQEELPSASVVTSRTQEEEAVPEEPAVPEPADVNPLTGEPGMSEEGIGKRPVAVMINNHPKSYPQLNLSQADVLFEVVVEHTLTRMLALFADYTQVPNLCSVRSYRYYFPAISNGFDAFYIHWGEDTTMMDYYRELNLDSYDGLSNTYLFGRDQNRLDAGYDLEHTSTFYGTLLPDQLYADGKRLELDEAHQGLAFNFVPYGTVRVPGEEACNFIDIQFGEQTGQFTYDAESGKYLKYANENPQIDGMNGEQLAFENVLTLYTFISDREGDEADRKWLDTFGVPDVYATGYYASEGTVQNITWYRENESDRFHFFDENGEEIQINRGKTYIAFTYFDSITVSDTIPDAYLQ